MRFRTLLSAILAVLCLFAPMAWAAPLEVFGRLPAVSTASVSPSGGLLALIVSDGERRSVVVQDIATKAFKARADFGDVTVQRVRWADDENLLITTNVPFDPRQLSGGLMDWRRAHLFNVPARTLKPLLGDTGSAVSAVIGVPQVRNVAGKPRVFLEGFQTIRGALFTAVYAIDLKTGRSTMVQPALVGSRRWLVDSRGEVVAREIHNSKPDSWELEIRDANGWRTVVRVTDPRDSARILGLSRDGSALIYEQQDRAGGRIWHTVRLDGGPSAAPILLPATESPLIDPQTGQVIGHEGWTGDLYQTSYFDPADQQVMDVVRQTFPAIQASISSWSNDRNVVVAYIDRPGYSPGHALFDLKAKRAEWVASDYPGLGTDDIGNQARVRFKANDGLDLAGYLTRPPGKTQAKGLPLVVLVHDGPSRRDTPGFDWIGQALASRGYAVLQVNYRGSAGLGEVLKTAGDGEIGRRMQTDLSDAIHALAAAGVVDPGRVCAVGEGYGGYAAVAGVIRQKGVYRCAVSMRGFFEVSWPKSGAAPGSERGAGVARWLGVSGPDDPTLADLSLLRHADGASAPILLVHGDKDTGRDAASSRAMAEALEKAGKSVEFKLVKDGDRQLANASASLETLTAVVTFLEKHNPTN